MQRCDDQQHIHAPVVLWQRTRDSVEHPGAAEIEPVDVRQLRIVAIGDDCRPQPPRRITACQIGEKAFEPARKRLRGRARDA